MLRGNIADFPLVGILQMLQRDNRSGTIRFDYAQGATIGVLSGRVVHAFYAPSKGERALSLISSIQTSSFEFHADHLPIEESIDRPAQILMMEIHREASEWRNLRSRLRNWTLAPIWATSVPSSENPERLEVIGLIDGQRSIEDILHQSDLPPRRAAELLIEFANEQLIHMGSASQITQPLELMVLPIYAPDETTIFVDQTLYTSWKTIYGTVLATLFGAKGERQTFRVKGRDNILGRVQIAETAMRKLKLTRGVKVTIVPSGGTR